MRIDIEQAAIDVPIGRPATDGLDGLGERFVVEDAAVDKGGFAGVEIGEEVGSEIPIKEVDPTVPSDVPLRNQGMDLAQLHRRESPGERRSSSRAEDERGQSINIKRTGLVAPRPMSIGVAQDLTMLAVADHRRIMDWRIGDIAPEVG